MKAMVLAAGEGTRLRPLTLDRPKPMVPIAGRPLLEHTVAWLRRHGVVDIAMNLHYRPEAIPAHFGDGSAFGVRITYSREERLLGTAGAVRRLRNFFDESFVVVYGDVLTDLDLTNLAGWHRERGGAVTIALYHVDNPCARGIVDCDADGRVRRFVEKPRPAEVFTDLANAGVYIIQPGVIDSIPDEAPCDFGRDVFPALLARGLSMYGRPIASGEYLIDIGCPEAYARANEEWARRKTSGIPQEALR